MPRTKQRASYTVESVFYYAGTFYTRANADQVADLPPAVIAEHLAAGSVKGPPPGAGARKSRPRRTMQRRALPAPGGAALHSTTTTIRHEDQ